MPDYGPLYQAAGEQWNISPLLLQAMANEESGEGRNLGPSSAGAKGFMQFLDPTAKQYGVDVNDHMSSIYGAANYMADLMNKHRGDTRAALAEYNGSHPNSAYVNNVMGKFSQLNQAWGVGPPRTNARVPRRVPDTLGDEQKYAPNAPNNTPPGEYRFAPVGEGAPTAPPADGGKPYTFAPQPEEEEGGRSVPGGAPAGTQYLSAATSPGALATGQPIAEGRVPGFGFQATINLPPGTPAGQLQKAQLAAQQLGIPLDRIISGPEGRLAAVGEDGKPYFIEPQRVSSYYEPQTRYGPPGTPYEPNPYSANPYQRPFMPLVPQSPAAASGENLLRAGGAMLPDAVSGALTMGPALAAQLAGGPLAAGATAAGTTAAVDMARQGLVNTLLPQEQGQPILTGNTARDAALAGLTWWAGGKLPQAFEPGAENLLGARLPFTRRFMGDTERLTRQQPFGTQDRIAPWEPLQRGELQPGEVVRLPRPQAGGAPETPIPGAHPAASAPLIDEIPQAEAAGIPRYKSPEQLTAEDRRVPQDVPVPILPIRGERGAEARAVELLRHYAQAGNITPEAGARGTLAEITGNRGIAALERAMRDQAGPVANEIGQVIDANAAANRETLAGVRGSLDDLPGMRAARDRQTSALYQRAFNPTNTSPTDLTPTLNAIDRELRSPQAVGSPDIAAALRDVRSRLFQKDPITGRPILDEGGNAVLISDPEQAWGVRSAIGHEITSRSQSSNVDLRIAARHLGQVIKTLDQDIAVGAPDYAGFNQAYQEASKPITAMEYLHGRSSLVDATSGTPTLRGVQSTLDDIRKQQQLKSGWQPADDLSEQQIAQLEGLRDQLRRQANVQKGMPIGSPTFEKFATDQTMNLLTGPVGRTATRAAVGAAGMHATGSLSGALFGLAAPMMERGVVNRQMIMRDRINAHLTRLLLNRNGEGVAALRGGPPTPP